MPCSTASGRVQLYSMGWAMNILKLARESHARGWEIVDGLLGLSDRQLASLLASKDPSWPQIRSLVHRVEKWEERQVISGRPSIEWTKGMYESLLHVECKTMLTSLHEYLTGQLNKIE